MPAVPSQLTSGFTFSVVMWILISLLPSTTSGRLVRVWGLSGTSTMASRRGCMIGPPPDSA